MALTDVDLHAHSTASDGRHAPEELVALAAERGVRVLALTDHDTLRGVEAAQAAGRAHGVHVIAGIEISAKHPAQCHLLAWLPDPAPADFVSWTHAKEREREERAREMVDRLQAQGVAIDWEDVRAAARGNVGRPHVADALIARGHVATRREAFDRLIGSDCPSYVPSGRVLPADAVALAADAGAVVALAHPYSLELDDAALDAFVAELADAGLHAIEAHRGDQDATMQATYRDLARRHGLLVSVGSDFHALDRAADPRGVRELGVIADPGIDDDDLDALVSRLPGAPAALGR